MNFKKQAKILETFLDQELRNNIPLLVLSDDTIIYKRFKIKQNQIGLWELTYINNDVIDSFRLKASAVLAAKYYDKSLFKDYNEIKMLDSLHWSSTSDCIFFKHRYQLAKDLEKKELYFSRWDVARSRSSYYKKEISLKLINAF